jgi:molybdopterin converting factor small subunit
LKIQVRLYGVFRSAAGSSQIQLDVPSQKPTVRSVIEYLVAQTDCHDLKPLLIDDSTMDPRPNALIMVSGREISTLNGLDTIVSEGDELSLLPVAHGGG